ncbi:MAG TPA: SUMF1/EgtB/PvdO family nonheme iron enzyme, partial [Gemmata sp.]
KGKAVDTVVSYAVKDKTVYVLPVWVITDRVDRLVGEALGGWHECRPADRFLPTKAEGRVRVKFHVADLRRNPEVWDELQKKLRERINTDRGKAVKADELEFVSNIKDGSYRVALTADGVGNERLPAEVLVTEEADLPPGGHVNLALDRSMIALLEKGTYEFLPLAAVRLRVTGLLFMKFEKQQLQARATYVHDAVTAFRKRVASSAPPGAPLPDAFFSLTSGGNAESSHSITAALRESMSVTISSRPDANPGPVVAMLQDAVKGLVRQQELETLGANKRVAILLSNQMAIYAPIDELKKFCQSKGAQRTENIKAVLDDWNARRESRASNYNGSVSIGGYYKDPIFSAGGSAAVSGTVAKESGEEMAARKKREAEALSVGIDQLAQHFEGSIKKLSGISFDDSVVLAAVKKIELDFQSITFTTGYGLHTWPRVPLGAGDPVVSPAQQAEALARTRLELDEVRKLLGAAERVETLRRDLEKLDAALDRLAKREADWAKSVAESERKMKQALDAVQASEIKQLLDEIDRLKNFLNQQTQNTYAAAAARFADVPVGVQPPRLDCSGENGVDAATAKAAQLAWAKYLGRKVIEELDLGDGVTMRFALIPPGRYRCGSSFGGRNSEEGPQHIAVLTKPMYVGVTEVTQAQYETVTGTNPSHFQLDKGGAEAVKGLTAAERANLPVESVNWREANEFSGLLTTKVKLPDGWTKGGLPTEAEWECLARGGAAASLGVGAGEAEFNRAVWFKSNSEGRTHVVGGKAANAWGLYDTLGNVCEWCLDGMRDYTAGEHINPMGDLRDRERSLRGGCWVDDPMRCRAASRYRSVPASRNSNFGFRVCFRLG